MATSAGLVVHVKVTESPFLGVVGDMLVVTEASAIKQGKTKT